MSYPAKGSTYPNGDDVIMEIRSFLGLTDEMAYLVGLPIVFALIAIEVLVMAFKHVRYYKWDDTLGTLGMLAGNRRLAKSIS